MKNAPLFLITGACGTGKSTLIPELYQTCPQQVVLDMDALHPPLDDWGLLKQLWIQVAGQLLLNQKITILCGMIFPWEYDTALLQEQFTPCYIGLYCREQTLRDRLAARAWCAERIEEQLACNRWVVENADRIFVPAMPLIDTSRHAPHQAARAVSRIVGRTLKVYHATRLPEKPGRTSR